MIKIFCDKCKEEMYTKKDKDAVIINDDKFHFCPICIYDLKHWLKET